jgi:hypothetical protein
VEIKKIGPEHARDLGRLEAEIYPSQFCLGWQDFEEDLKSAESEGRNFSFGLFKGSELVGYITAYRVRNRIFVSDFAFLPNFRVGRMIWVLLVKFLQAASTVMLPIYAECRKESFRLCTRHPDFFKKFGYVLTKEQAKLPYGGEPSWAIRLEFAL